MTTTEDIDACAGAAETALLAFPHNNGIGNEDDGDKEDAILDLLTDLHHLSDALGFDFPVLLERARYHHDEDVREAAEEEVDELAAAVLAEFRHARDMQDTLDGAQSGLETPYRDVTPTEQSQSYRDSMRDAGRGGLLR